MDCALVLCWLLGEDFFSALHIFYVGSPLLEKHTWLLFGLHLPEWWIWEKRQSPFTLDLESVSLLQIAHILWSLFHRAAPRGAGLRVVRTAGNWKSQCLVYSRSRSAVITDLSYVPGISQLVTNQGKEECFVLFCFQFFWPHSVWGLSPPTRDWTCAFYIGSMESQPLEGQGSPRSVLAVALFT